MSRYDSDPVKTESNLRKHGVTFEEAESVISSPLSREEIGPMDPTGEERVKTIGWSSLARIIVVITSQGGPRPRIISARRASKRERDEYLG